MISQTQKLKTSSSTHFQDFIRNKVSPEDANLSMSILLVFFNKGSNK